MSAGFASRGSVAHKFGSYFADPHSWRQHGIGAVPRRRPMIGPMTPGIQLAECIEKAEILVIVHAGDIFGDWTTQRHHAKPLGPFGRKGLNRIVDLQRPLTVTDQQAEGCHAEFE